MYEKGVGVAADPQKALNLYRRAAGLTGDYVIVASGRYQELEDAAQKLALREQEIEDLQRQLDEARKQQKKDEARERELARQLDEARKQADTQKQDVSRVERLLRTAVTAAPAGPAPSLPS